MPLKRSRLDYIELDLDNTIKELNKFKQELGKKQAEVELLTMERVVLEGDKHWIEMQSQNFCRGMEKEKTRAAELATLIPGGGGEGGGGEEGGGGQEGGGGEGGVEVFNRELAVIDEKLRKNKQSLDPANFYLHDAKKKYDSASKTNAANTERLLFTVHYMTTLLSYIGTRTSSSAFWRPAFRPRRGASSSKISRCCGRWSSPTSSKRRRPTTGVSGRGRRSKSARSSDRRRR